jgi:cysteinyl-tRNA synthetase
MEPNVRLYNSLTRTVQPLEPRNGTSVQMFVCGPTVYDRVHLGNARTFTIFDVVAKWLRHRGYDVTYIQNITDIDDKIIARATEQGREPLNYAAEYDDAFRADMTALGNTAVSQYARATTHIPQVISQVKTLIAKGNVYLIEKDGWYFDLTTFPDYGKLSGRTGIAAQDAVSRIDDSDKKRNTGDFCVWKLSKPGEPVWEDAELGAGRPGWHIEDTSITEHYFGPQYDIHGGGMDLKFPHHEAEIAQQEAASGKVPFVKYWMHAGFLENKTEKMSKSKGNFATLHELLKTYDPAVLRFYLLSNHYRSPLDFSDKALDAAQAAVNRMSEVMHKKSDTVVDTASVMTEIADAMDDDFNTPRAFGAIFNFVKEINTKGAIPPQTFFATISELFGIIPTTTNEIPGDIQKLVDERQTAREQKDFTTSDSIRDRLAEHGYTVDDTPYGPLLKKKNG